MNNRKVLVCFDFDHTLIDCNSDTGVKHLATNISIPEEIQNIAKNTKNWNLYMSEMFKFLHKTNVTKDNYISYLSQLPLVKGMKELLHLLHNSGQCEIIIISDANTVFIKTVLTRNHLNDYVYKIFTNPAEFDSNGCLQINGYHNQTDCALCPSNLCKGFVVNDYLTRRKEEGVQFSKVLFIGDGVGDLCVAFKLKKDDIIFARCGYHLQKRLDRLHKGEVQACIQLWDNGNDIKCSLNDLVVLH